MEDFYPQQLFDWSTSQSDLIHVNDQPFDEISIFSQHHDCHQTTSGKYPNLEYYSSNEQNVHSMEQFPSTGTEQSQCDYKQHFEDAQISFDINQPHLMQVQSQLQQNSAIQNENIVEQQSHHIFDAKVNSEYKINSLEAQMKSRSQNNEKFVNQVIQKEDHYPFFKICNFLKCFQQDQTVMREMLRSFVKKRQEFQEQIKKLVYNQVNLNSFLKKVVQKNKRSTFSKFLKKGTHQEIFVGYFKEQKDSTELLDYFGKDKFNIGEKLKHFPRDMQDFLNYNDTKTLLQRCFDHSDLNKYYSMGRDQISWKNTQQNLKNYKNKLPGVFVVLMLYFFADICLNQHKGCRNQTKQAYINHFPVVFQSWNQEKGILTSIYKNIPAYKMLIYKEFLSELRASLQHFTENYLRNCLHILNKIDKNGCLADIKSGIDSYIENKE